MIKDVSCSFFFNRRHSWRAAIRINGLCHGWPNSPTVLFGCVVLPPLHLYEPTWHRALRDVQFAPQLKTPRNRAEPYIPPETAVRVGGLPCIPAVLVCLILNSSPPSLTVSDLNAYASRVLEYAPNPTL